MYLNVSLEYETNWLVCWLDMLLWTTQIIWLEETPHTCPDSNKRNNSLKVNLRILSQLVLFNHCVERISTRFLELIPQIMT